MSATKCPSRKLKGLSFEISDLILIQDRAQANDFRMVVRLDHSSDIEEYEEVLVFYVGTSPLSQWMMWRNRVFAIKLRTQPALSIGRPGDRGPGS